MRNADFGEVERCHATACLGKEQCIVAEAATDLKYSGARPSNTECKRCRNVC
ncbi:hypothetical protein [Corallococcus sicarius]|uniref:hypothetical protein n=1 Tax=Corallococcus sicarius TaxID=2316726 RepID=UPI0031344B6C